MTTYRPTAWLGLLTLVVMFGSAFLLTKIALNDLPPLTIITGRIVVAALTLWCIVLYQRQAILELLPYWKLNRYAKRSLYQQFSKGLPCRQQATPAEFTAQGTRPAIIRYGCYG